MRLLPRLIAFLVLLALAFWFTAENANELVSVDLAFVRIRASLPIVVFSSVIVGMVVAIIWGWRADRAYGVSDS